MTHFVCTYPKSFELDLYQCRWTAVNKRLLNAYCRDKFDKYCVEEKCLHRTGTCGAQLHESVASSRRCCHTLTGNLKIDINYKKVLKTEIDKKTYKFVGEDELSYQ